MIKLRADGVAGQGVVVWGALLMKMLTVGSADFGFKFVFPGQKKACSFRSTVGSAGSYQVKMLTCAGSMLHLGKC